MAEQEHKPELGSTDAVDMLDPNALFGKKKRKPKKKTMEGEDVPRSDASATVVSDTAVDMTYDEMLARIMNSLRTINPTLQQESKLILPPPQVGREGKKSIFTNFEAICTALHRDPDHVQTFMLNELGCQGNLDGQRSLVVRDRFQPRQFEIVLKRYIREYVQCNSCKSTDTLLSRDEGRIFQLTCGRCGL